MKINKAFTLIEIMVALVIVGIIAGFTIVQMNGAANIAKDAKRKADINIIKTALGSYRSEHYSIGPVQEAQCGIGTDCANLDSSLQSFLGTAPKDPNGTSYTYQTNADGSNCFITAILSNGTAYQYSCDSDSFSTVAAINGTCGLSVARSLDISSPGLCTSGTAVSFTGTGPWDWVCSGSNGGVNSGTCTAAVSTNGVCGSASKQYSYESSGYGTDQYCQSGTPSSTPAFPLTGNSATWICLSSNGGTDSGICTASHPTQCAAAGGTVGDCGGVACCQFTGGNCTGSTSFCDHTDAVCPAGWVQDQGWSATYSGVSEYYPYNTQNYIFGDGSFCYCSGEWCVPVCGNSCRCNFTGHAFANNSAKETCSCTWHYSANGSSYSPTDTLTTYRTAIGCVPQ